MDTKKAEEKLLSALRSHSKSFLSGAQLSRASGVSRTTIWKRIEKLREEGYQIVAQPHLGYRLVAAPDRLIPDELKWSLKTACVGKKIYSFASTDSTMDVAHRLVDHGEPAGSGVLAERQTKGRGRLGRSWISPAGSGIYLSVILKPKIAMQKAAVLTVLGTVAVVEAIEQCTGLVPQIKWPNDVLINGKKVAGILTELKAELNQIHAAIIGIGFNVNSSKSSLPRHATSLSVESHHKVDRLQVAKALLVALDHTYGQLQKGKLDSLLTRWRKHSMTLGRRVRVDCQDRHVDGEAIGLDKAGALLVRTDTGRMEPITAGEVLIVR